MVFFLVAAGAAFGLLASMPAAPHRFLSAALLLALAVREGWALAKGRAAPKALAAKAYTLSGFLVWRLLRNECAPFYLAASKAANGFSALVGAAVGRPASLGITYSGADVAVFFAIALASAAAAYRRGFARQPLLAPRAAAGWRAARRCLLWLLGIALIWAAYIVAWTHLAESSIAIGLNLIEPLTGPLDYRALLFAMLLAFCARAYANLERADAGAGAGV
ncbi:MAG: hypothetical protein LBJ10_05850, partial [Clostridiales bacterium]|nr:hypothetical protein [Clostridiales bacterium]